MARPALEIADIFRDHGSAWRRANQGLARYTQAVADARSHAGEVAKGLREKVKLEVETERARIEAEIAARISEAEKRIAAAKARALASVGEIANEVARAIVSKLIDEEVTTDEVKSALVKHAAE